MEVSSLKKLEKLEFSLDSVTDLSSHSVCSSSPGVSTFSCVDGVTELRFLQSDSLHCFNFDLASAQLFKLGPVQFIILSDSSRSSEEKSYSRGVSIKFTSEKDSKDFCETFEEWSKDALVQGSSLQNGTVSTNKSKFDNKIEAASAKMYFHCYGKIPQQQNVLQDNARTGTYYAAVMENRSDFAGRVVVDVGAGSGILSLFAAQAGAKHVYAVEASEMAAEYARKLIAGNPLLAERITVIKGKVEDIELPEKTDILISEPMGTLLVNERMLESYVIARDRFMSPNGKMFPTVGRIHMAPFSDEFLFMEMANKALFWQQQNYYGVNLTSLSGSAHQGYFSQPVVDAFDPRLLVAPPMFHMLDFTKMKEEDFYEIDIPLKFTASVCTRLHGLACWFDVLFDGSTVQRWLSTAPGAPTTHWYQIRCVLSQPLYVMAGQEITGRLHLVAHSAQSYTIDLTLSAKMGGPDASQGGILQSSSGRYNLKEPYYRMSQSQTYHVAQGPLQSLQQINTQNSKYVRRTLTMQAQNTIPEAILEEIICILPDKSLGRFKVVSREWNSIIMRSPFAGAPPQLLFITLQEGLLHFFSSAQENDSLIVMAECKMRKPYFISPFERRLPFRVRQKKDFSCVRGLVMFKETRDGYGMIHVSNLCNPSTGQSFFMPIWATKQKAAVWSYLGYDPIDGEYKVISVVKEGTVFGKVLVHTVGGGGRRREIESSIPHFPHPSHSHISINGILYYSAMDIPEKTYLIVCVDVRREKMSFIDESNSSDPSLRDELLINFNGKLGLLAGESVDGNWNSVKLRVLEDGTNWSESRFYFPDSWENFLVGGTRLRLTGFTSRGEIVLSPSSQTQPFFIIFFNIYRRTIRRLQIRGMEAMKDHPVYTFPDHSSLVSDFKF